MARNYRQNRIIYCSYNDSLWFIGPSRRVFRKNPASVHSLKYRWIPPDAGS